MLMAMAAGWFVGWAPTKLIVSRWRRWWVALLAIVFSLTLVLCAALFIAVLDRANANATGVSSAFGGVFVAGAISTLWTAISTLRKKSKTEPSYADSYGYGYDPSRFK